MTTHLPPAANAPDATAPGPRRSDAPGTAAVHSLWGAEPAGDGDWHFRLWAPEVDRVTLRLSGRDHAMERGADGVHRARCPAVEGADYAFAVGGRTIPDPAARWQPGLRAPSRLLDPATLRRGRLPWPGRPFDETVVVEIHVGSFTPEGTFAAAARSPQLRRLAELGVTAVELMPIAAFPGRHGWGYDPVFPHAPHPDYGTPQDLCRLIDAIHGLGMMVFVDVVYNHFGPEGCGLFHASPGFFADDDNLWGRSIDFTRAAVHDFFITAGEVLVRDYGVDGLRLDAVDSIVDPTEPGFLVAFAERLRALPLGRPVHLMTEDDRNITRLHAAPQRLYDGEWNDDYHHALHVLLTGERFDHYGHYADDPLGDLCLALSQGYVLQGQPRPDGHVKGEPSADLPWDAMVNFNLNHDHAGNRPQGERLIALAGEARARVAHALLLSAPHTPLMFMGEEIGATAPFPFFADYAPPLADLVRDGRRRELRNRPGVAAMTDPFDPGLPAAANPYRDPPAHAAAWQALTGDLLTLRREVLLPLFRSGRAGAATAETAGDAAVTAAWPFRAGRLRVLASFGGRVNTAVDGAARFGIGEIGQGAPAFRLWIDPAHR